MPFLLPALGSLICDGTILYLLTLSSSYPVIDDDDDESRMNFLYHVNYIGPLVMIRLFLVLIPLPYHNYTGTAIPFRWCYEFFYGSTLLLVLFQLLGILIFNPQSLSTLWILQNDQTSQNEEDDIMIMPTTTTTITNSTQVSTPTTLLHSTTFPMIYWILGLHLLSNLLHLILLWHVRSTGPMIASWTNHPSTSPITTTTTSSHSLFYVYAKRHSQQQQQQKYENDSNQHSSTILNGSRNDIETTSNNHSPRILLERIRCVPDGYDEIMSRLHQRFQIAKHLWSQRLEDFTMRMNRSTHGGGSVGTTNPITNGSHTAAAAATTTTLVILPTTPFRVLLQLFAYEQDVMSQLDLVFEKDDGATLTFYVPQLLSFLIHGAYHNTADLEAWILDRCQTNVNFAHCCFWFLRAWCLEGSHEEQKQKSLESNKHSVAGSGQAQAMSRNNSFTSLLGMDSNHYSKSLTSTKYSPEERSVIQALLDRVVECGEIAAQNLHQSAEGVYLTTGPMVTTDDDGFVTLDASPSAVMNAIDAGFLPIDPMSNSPSVHHLDSMYSHIKTGLLPVQSDPPPYPLFLQAPHFLDALLNLADSLFGLPREQRTAELRQQLKILEVAWLPSNVIYVPITATQHRIWRIVAEESIAISTKERVPCIVTLEVIDYCPFHHSSTTNRNRSFSSTSSGFQEWMMRDDGPPDERDVLNAWRTSRRNPRRFESLLDKVTTFTRDTARSAHETLQKLQHRSLMTRSEDETEDEEMVSLTTSLPQSAALTPIKGGSGPPTAAAASMGQWSSPISSISPSKYKGLQKGLSWRRGERILANSESSTKTEDEQQQQVMDALMTIRRKMEIRQEQNGGFLSTNDVAGTYGTTQKRPSRPPPVVFKESWSSKETRLRAKSVYGSHPNWRLLPILIKSNDDLRQEQLASQLIYRMASILAHEKVPVWLCPYEIVALTDRGGIIEAIPDTISLDSLKRNDPNFSTLLQFFETHFDGEALLDARANFVESLAGYSIVSFLLQIKDRHNGNILLDNRGHLIHIDFGFFFLSSPGKNSGFESAPFKLTSDFVDLMGGPHSHVFRMFRELCCRTFLALRKHCLEITLLVEMLMVGNEDLHCFCNRPEEAIRGLRERFRLDWNDRACTEYVNTLIDDSLENWRTRWYDRYQRFCVGVL